MSELGALYYPYHPEDGVWLRHSLLYYDFIATTVPTQFEKVFEDCALPKYLLKLRDQGAYRPTIDEVGFLPVAHWLAKLDPAFEFASVKGAEDFAILSFLNPSFTAEDTKTGDIIKLANLLAEAVASLSKVPLVPSTDSEPPFRHLYGSEEHNSAQEVRRAAYITYYQLLPSPKANTSLTKILDFKSKYRDELLRLQTALAKTREKIGNSVEPTALKQTAAEMEKEILSAAADLRSALGASSIDTSVGLLKELVAAKPPFHSGLISVAGGIGAAVATGADPSKLSPEQAAIGLGIASAISVASAFVSMISSRQDKLRKSPYAYLYLAEKKDIIRA